jgi:hypothetical protein
MRSESISMATFGLHMYQIHLLGECGACTKWQSGSQQSARHFLYRKSSASASLN